ncbi:MAG: hypothetical protein P4M11_01960 [Candidatus Pacebacteria bacterium]|nr:hypothetical protein [Candidatus Paceibacterota bacterium]
MTKLPNAIVAKLRERCEEKILVAPERVLALLDERDELIKERDEAFLAGQQSLAHSLHAAESAADAWKTLAEKEKERADNFMWQVRDTCARAESAEVDRDAAIARAEKAEAERYEARLDNGTNEEVISIARQILNESGVPCAAFFEDHVRNVVVLWKRAEAERDAAAARAEKAEALHQQAEQEFSSCYYERQNLRDALNASKKGAQNTDEILHGGFVDDDLLDRATDANKKETWE